VIDKMSLPEATLHCPICDSLEHTLFMIQILKYKNIDGIKNCRITF